MSSETDQTDEVAQREWEPKLWLTVTPGSNGVSLMTWNGANRIAVVGRERSIHVHDFDVSLNSRINLDFEASEIRFTKKDLLITAALTGDVSIFRLRQEFSRTLNIVQSQRHLLAHNCPVFALDVDPSGTSFITAGADKVVKLWTVSGQKLTGQFRKHTNAVRHLVFTADGSGFASAGDDKDIVEWDCRSPNPITSIGSHCGGGASALSYLPEGHLLVGHRDSNLRVFDARTKKVLATYRVYDKPIRSFSLHTSGHFVATSSTEDQCVSIIDLLDGAPLTTFTVKLPVKQTAFLSPCDGLDDDPDISDLLCIPSRGRKLSIFNCDLHRLLKEDAYGEVGCESFYARAIDGQSSQVINQATIKTDLPSKSATEIPKGERNVVKSEFPPAVVCFDGANGTKNQENSTSSTGRPQDFANNKPRKMTLLRRSVKPKQILMEDISEEEASNMDGSGQIKQLKSFAGTGKGDILDALVDLIGRLDRFQTDVTETLADIKQRVSALECKIQMIS